MPIPTQRERHVSPFCLQGHCVSRAMSQAGLSTWRGHVWNVKADGLPSLDVKVQKVPRLWLTIRARPRARSRRNDEYISRCFGRADCRRRRRLWFSSGERSWHSRRIRADGPRVLDFFWAPGHDMQLGMYATGQRAGRAFITVSSSRTSVEREQLSCWRADLASEQGLHGFECVEVVECRAYGAATSTHAIS